MVRIKQFFASQTWQDLKALRLPKEGVVAGVCSALGTVTPLAPWMWRVLFCLISIFWGFGLIVYIILWVCIPVEGDKD